MKVLKPLTLSMLTRPFEAKGQRRLGVHVMAMVPLTGAPSLRSEQELWQLVSEALDVPVIEEGIPKSRAEWLLAGRAFPPGGRGVTCPVEVRFADQVKRASVIGDRRWERGVPTEPEPFDAMPLTWARAFGGEGVPANPVGVGAAPVERDGHTAHRLPNVEHPDRLIRSPSDRPTPVGFGAIDLRWSTRAQHAGTYDARWLETRFPGVADDLDWRLFNLAPPDQQRDEPFRGTERYALTNLHPDRARIEGALPGLRARAFLIRGEVAPADNEGRPEGPLEEVETRLMTVWLFPEQDRAVLIWSGVADVVEDDARDVRLLMVACERFGAPRPVAHYEGVVDARCDKDTSVIHALLDEDLVPGDLIGPLPTALPGLETADHLAANQRRGRARRLAASRELGQAHGLDIAELGLELAEDDASESPPALRDIPAFLEAKQRELADLKRDEDARREAKLREVEALCERHGVDPAPMIGANRATRRGPPTFTADEHREGLRELARRAERAGSPLAHLEAQIEDPAQHEAWRQQEARLRELYRSTAHMQDPASTRDEAASAALREELVEAARRGVVAAGRDLTGVDLSGLDLTGIDLRGAFLESAGLRGTVLEGATLDGAVLAHADLTGARLARASLRDANLGRARADGVELTGADLGGATLSYASLAGASLVGASISEAMLLEVDLTGANLSEVRATGVFWVRVTLDETDWSRADLGASTFVECAARRARFEGARVEAVTFVTSDLSGARLSRARGDQLRIVHGSGAAGADLRLASLRRANLRDLDLSGADLSGANLDDADLSGANLTAASLFRTRARGARFVGASLRDATMMQADLFEAFLTKADVRGADLRDASLFGADLALVHGDAATKMDGANRLRVRVRPMRSA